MNITIKGKDYNIHFGIGFMRKMDEKHNTKGVGGEKFGTGIEIAIPKMTSGDYTALQEILYCGMGESKPNQKDFDDFIDSIEDIDGFVQEVIDELKNSNAARKRTEATLQEVELTEKKS